MGLGTTEILIIAAIVILLFGAKKLPDLARGSGRALRIFKSETKGLMDDEDKDRDKTDPHGRPLPPGTSHTDVESHQQPQQQASQPPQQPAQPPQSQDGAPRDQRA